MRSRGADLKFETYHHQPRKNIANNLHLEIRQDIHTAMRVYGYLCVYGMDIFALCVRVCVCIEEIYCR